MKQIGRLLVAGIALGVGHEIGRAAFMTGVHVLNKKFREDVKTEYKRRLRVVPETPTGA